MITLDRLKSDWIVSVVFFVLCTTHKSLMMWKVIIFDGIYLLGKISQLWDFAPNGRAGGVQMIRVIICGHPLLMDTSKVSN